MNQSSTVQVYRIPIDEVSMSRNAHSSRVSKSNLAEWKSNHDKSTFTRTVYKTPDVRRALWAQHSV